MAHGHGNAPMLAHTHTSTCPHLRRAAWRVHVARDEHKVAVGLSAVPELHAERAPRQRQLQPLAAPYARQWWYKWQRLLGRELAAILGRAVEWVRLRGRSRHDRHQRGALLCIVALVGGVAAHPRHRLYARARGGGSGSVRAGKVGRGVGAVGASALGKWGEG
eukprot:359531-Chlamydomonas_euryale.AAC.2